MWKKFSSIRSSSIKMAAVPSASCKIRRRKSIVIFYAVFVVLNSVLMEFFFALLLLCREVRASSEYLSMVTCMDCGRF